MFLCSTKDLGAESSVNCFRKKPISKKAFWMGDSKIKLLKFGKLVFTKSIHSLTDDSALSKFKFGRVLYHLQTDAVAKNYYIPTYRAHFWSDILIWGD